MANRRIKGSFISLAFGLGLFVLLVPLSHAVIISPVQLDLSIKNPIASFTVTNDSAVTLTYQSSALSWVQIDGQDIQVASDDLIVTPPIISIIPKRSQVFRVALFKPSPQVVEQSYRIIMEDISADVNVATETGVSFRFNHNIPVFYAPYTSIDSIFWSLCESHIAEKSCLQIENKGNRHMKVIQFTAVSESAEEPGNFSKTLLAGSSSQWLFSKVLGAENTNSIKLITDKGPITLSLKDLPRSK